MTKERQLNKQANQDVPTFEDLIKNIYFILWILGIDEDKVHTRFYCFLVFFFPVCLQELAYMFMKTTAENLVVSMGLVPCICYCIISILKIIALASNKSIYFKLIHEVKILYKDITSDPIKLKLVQPKIMFLKVLIKYLYILNFSLASVYNISSIIIILYNYIITNKMVFNLPFPEVVPFSTDTWLTWGVVYFNQICDTYICVMYIVTVDGLYFILCTNVCIHFIIINKLIQNLNNSNVHLINEYIKYHQYVIKLSEDVDTIFKTQNFCNISSGSFQICALGFCLSFGKWKDTPGYLLFLASVLFQLWMISIFGENIMYESNQVGISAYHCVWPDMDMKTRKTILLIITRSQRPQKLTAYIFSTISCGGFQKVLSSSWSYFSILRTVYSPPDSSNSLSLS